LSYVCHSDSIFLSISPEKSNSLPKIRVFQNLRFSSLKTLQMFKSFVPNGEISECEEGPGPTSKKKKVEKMMFEKKKVDIMRT